MPTNEDRPKARTSASGFDLSPPTAAERERLASTLSAEERRVLLHQGTEPPFCGGLLANKEAGVYRCRMCDLPLFGRPRNSTRARVGRVSPRRSIQITSRSAAMLATEWSVTRSFAPGAVATWATCSRTVRDRRDFGTA